MMQKSSLWFIPSPVSNAVNNEDDSARVLKQFTYSPLICIYPCIECGRFFVLKLADKKRVQADELATAHPPPQCGQQSFSKSINLQLFFIPFRGFSDPRDGATAGIVVIHAQKGKGKPSIIFLFDCDENCRHPGQGCQVGPFSGPNSTNLSFLKLSI